MSRKKDKKKEMEAQADNQDVLEQDPQEEEGVAAAGTSEEDTGESPEPELTAEELLTRERDEYKEKWLRMVAELDNLRKRTSRQLVDGRRFAQAEVLRSFLDVHDNFERALQSMTSGEDTENSQSLREGVELIFQNYRRVLKDQGVEAIEALEQEFDPAFHEAVGQFAREGVEAGVVIEVVQQGFRLGDMVLRPSRVIISC